MMKIFLSSQACKLSCRTHGRVSFGVSIATQLRILVQNVEGADRE